MKIKDFEAKIQKEIDAELSVRTNPNHGDIAGVYYKNTYLGVAVPPEEIREEVDKGYSDKLGYPYKSIKMAEDFINGKLPLIKQAMIDDPDLFVDDK